MEKATGKQEKPRSNVLRSKIMQQREVRVHEEAKPLVYIPLELDESGPFGYALRNLYEAGSRLQPYDNVPVIGY
jgi:hypothetical protein